MGIGKKLQNGEKIECRECRQGFYQPLRENLPTKDQKQFICPVCGSKVLLNLKMPMSTDEP